MGKGGAANRTAAILTAMVIPVTVVCSSCMSIVSSALRLTRVFSGQEPDTRLRLFPTVAHCNPSAF